jgi:hypothetical protein
MRPGNYRMCNFGWSEGNPVSYLLKYIAFGEGDTAQLHTKFCDRPKRIRIKDRSCMLEVDVASDWSRE